MNHSYNYSTLQLTYVLILSQSKNVYKYKMQDWFTYSLAFTGYPPTTQPPLYHNPHHTPSPPQLSNFSLLISVPWFPVLADKLDLIQAAGESRICIAAVVN